MKRSQFSLGTLFIIALLAIVAVNQWRLELAANAQQAEEMSYNTETRAMVTNLAERVMALELSEDARAQGLEQRLRSLQAAADRSTLEYERLQKLIAYATAQLIAEKEYGPEESGADRP